jgi:chloramphenicol-sensitive protein RarD
MKQSEKTGIFYAAFAYLLWGLLPIYWKLLEHVPAKEILASRVFWSFWFMVIVLCIARRQAEFRETLTEVIRHPKKGWALVIAGFLVTGNWFIYIWAVNSEKMVEASLGYYINPLVNVVLGIFVLKEVVNRTQIFSFLLAGIGVMILTVSYGKFPWVAFSLAFTFALYGLAKKLVKVDSAIGLTLETMVVTPMAFIYMIHLFLQGELSFLAHTWTTDVLLIGAGAATAIPLLYFGKGAQLIPFYMLGFLQYIAPTLTLLLGVFVYKETFSSTHLLAFTFIWVALILFSLSKTKRYEAFGNKWKNKRSLST